MTDKELKGLCSQDEGNYQTQTSWDLEQMGLRDSLND